MFSNALLIICVALIVICLRSFSLWRKQGLRLDRARQVNDSLVKELNDSNKLIEELDARLDNHAAYIDELEGILDNQQSTDTEQELHDRLEGMYEQAQADEARIAHLERVLDMGSDKVRELAEAKKELQERNDELCRKLYARQLELEDRDAQLDALLDKLSAYER
jgi:TolA-binding protein